MYMVISSALKWVIKGLALAPPYKGWRTGVSTSKKPWLVYQLRMAWSIFALLIKVVRTSGFEIKSKYL